MGHWQYWMLFTFNTKSFEYNMPEADQHLRNQRPLILYMEIRVKEINSTESLKLDVREKLFQTEVRIRRNAIVFKTWKWRQSGLSANYADGHFEHFYRSINIFRLLYFIQTIEFWRQLQCVIFMWTSSAIEVSVKCIFEAS